MQTFLPYHDIEKSVRILDSKRLSRQIIEVYHILKVLSGLAEGYKNHPTALMWQGYEGTLKAYGILACREWRSRNNRDSMEDRIKEFSMEVSFILPEHFTEEFHASHRSKLYHKFPSYYKQFFGENLPVLDYVWPVRAKNG